MRKPNPPFILSQLLFAKQAQTCKAEYVHTETTIKCDNVLLILLHLLIIITLSLLILMYSGT